MPAFSIRHNSRERRILQIPLERILPPSLPSRRCFDETQLHSLADSISRFGLLAPLLVRRCGNDYQLIAGQRRLLALQMLGRSHAEVIVSEAFDRDCALMGLIENLQREEMHYLDTALCCRRIIREHSLTQEELASSLGKSASALANLMRLLHLPREVRDCIREGGLSQRHARALLGVQAPERQLELAQLAIRQKMSVRQLEAAIAREPQVSSGSTTGVIRDNRLVINALQDTVRQLRRMGISASSRVENHADHYDIIVTIRTGNAQ